MDLNEFRIEAEKVSGNLQTRIPAYIKPLIEDETKLINCHCHIFNQKTVPKAFYNMKMPYSRKLVVKIIKFLQTLNSRSNDDWASRYAYFIELFIQSTKKISDKLVSYYPPNTIFTPLMMDMHNRTSSDKRKHAEYYIEEQGKDIGKLIEEKYKFLPFLPIDPTFTDKKNPNLDVFDVFIKGFNGEYGFTPFGIKIYPSLGYLPWHPKLMEIFKVCEEKNIPVTAHCSSGTVHGYKKRLKNIEGWKIGRDGKLTNKPESRWFLSGDAYANYFNHPKNWYPVLEQMPKLKINFGHFGGDYNTKKIKCVLSITNIFPLLWHQVIAKTKNYKKTTHDWALRKADYIMTGFYGPVYQAGCTVIWDTFDYNKTDHNNRSLNASSLYTNPPIRVKKNSISSNHYAAKDGANSGTWILKLADC